jgi:hypothetical protein
MSWAIAAISSEESNGSLIFVSAGVLYLVVGVTGGFSEGYVDPSMYVAGDAPRRLETWSRTQAWRASRSSRT